jgi:hypothetical protein
MSEISTKEAQGKETSHHKAVTIGTTDINFGYSLQEIIKIIQTTNKKKAPVFIWTNQPDKNLSITIPYKPRAIQSILGESSTIFAKEFREKNIIYQEGKTVFGINPINFYAAISKENTDNGVVISNVTINTKQAKSEIESEIKSVTNGKIPKNWIFN